MKTTAQCALNAIWLTLWSRLKPHVATVSAGIEEPG